MHACARTFSPARPWSSPARFAERCAAACRMSRSASAGTGCLDSCTTSCQDGSIRQLKARILDAGRGRGRSPPQAPFAHAAARWAALPVRPVLGRCGRWIHSSSSARRLPVRRLPKTSWSTSVRRCRCSCWVIAATDHISPVGAIGAGTAAGRYLEERGLAESEFGTFSRSSRQSSRDGSRHLGKPPLLRNHLVTGEGPFTRDVRTGEIGTVFEVRMHQAAGIPSVVIAGSAYGSGSARDWAAKGTRLLGIRAVIARDFEHPTGPTS